MIFRSSYTQLYNHHSTIADRRPEVECTRGRLCGAPKCYCKCVWIPCRRNRRNQGREPEAERDFAAKWDVPSQGTQISSLDAHIKSILLLNHLAKTFDVKTGEKSGFAAHPLILQAIQVAFFSGGSKKRSALGLRYPADFNPMPNETIAFILTIVSPEPGPAPPSTPGSVYVADADTLAKLHHLDTCTH